VCAYLKDCHPNRIDIRVLRGKLVRELASKPEHIREKQLRRHPPSRALHFTIGGGGPTSRFINNRRKCKVRQPSAALGIYQDVDLAGSFSVVTNCTVNQELTPLRSPWTTLCSCRYSNPVTASTSCPDDQCDRRISLSLHSRDAGDCSHG